MNRYLAVILWCALTACSAPHGLVPSSSGAAPLRVSQTLTPDHGASALPGGWLPCGWPVRGGNDAAGNFRYRFFAKCSIALSTASNSTGNAEPLNSGYLFPLQPAALASFYRLSPSGPGMTVAVVDAYDDPNAEKELAVYRTAFGLPACTSTSHCFHKVNQAGRTKPYPKFNPGWSSEIALDIEMISAICPRCSILLVEANSDAVDDLGASVDTAVALGARIVSNSYYAIEWPGELAEDVHYHHPGVAIVVSSGDQIHPMPNAATPGLSSVHDGPYYPATSPYVTSVGGTQLVPYSGSWLELAWGNTGQGCSRYEPRPAFQSALCATRAGVDMAVVADPKSPVQIYSMAAGGWVKAGGTSVGAPIVAAAYALSGNPQGPGFSYRHRSAFRDIFPKGFDLSTGLGSPRGLTGF